jgi:hypothetical protein
MYVYLIGSKAFGWYKIGKAKDVSIRLKQIGILLPFKVEAVAVWAVWSGNVEATLHRKYRDNQIHGEWFRFTKHELKILLSEPVENATLLDKHSALEFRNMERDCAEGRHIRVKAVANPSSILTQQHILAKKLIKDFRKDISSSGEVVPPLKNGAKLAALNEIFLQRNLG